MYILYILFSETYSLGSVYRSAGDFIPKHPTRLPPTCNLNGAIQTQVNHLVCSLCELGHPLATFVCCFLSVICAFLYDIVYWHHYLYKYNLCVENIFLKMPCCCYMRSAIIGTRPYIFQKLLCPIYVNLRLSKSSPALCFLVVFENKHEYLLLFWAFVWFLTSVLMLYRWSIAYLDKEAGSCLDFTIIA